MTATFQVLPPSGALISTAQLQLAAALPAVAAMCDHLVGHGALLERRQDEFRLSSPLGRAVIAVSGNHTSIRAEAPDIPSLYQLRSILAGHLAEFAPDAAVLVWAGDAVELTAPPNWRVLQVTSVTALTQRMHRIRFQGQDLALFAGLRDIHVRLAFPPAGKALLGPSVSPSGRESWPDHPDRPQLRRYTIREVDAAAGWLDVDFVLHEEASGPGSRFASTAQAGDVIGMIGPGGGTIPLDHDWYLIAGDETALPAIIRMAALLPPDVQGEILIALHDPAEAQPVAAPPGIRIRHLRRDELVEAVAAVTLPPSARRPFVWVGCEYVASCALRGHVRDGLRLKKGQHCIVAYWRADGEA